MTVIGALSSFRELGEMSPHKHPSVPGMQFAPAKERMGLAYDVSLPERRRAVIAGVVGTSPRLRIRALVPV